jgi:hypothetical protein
MPKRLRRAVSTHFRQAGKALEKQFKTRSIMMGEMERRGYSVQGKTDEQIVQMLQGRMCDKN